VQYNSHAPPPLEYLSPFKLNRPKNPFVPEGKPRRTRIAPLGQSPKCGGPSGASFGRLAQSGYTRSVPFSRNNDSSPRSCDIRALQGKIPAFHLFLLELFWTYCSPGRGARINILRKISYGNLSAYHRTDWACLGSLGTRS
jgi:hypothetical protein